MLTNNNTQLDFNHLDGVYNDFIEFAESADDDTIKQQIVSIRITHIKHLFPLMLLFQGTLKKLKNLKIITIAAKISTTDQAYSYLALIQFILHEIKLEKFDVSFGTKECNLCSNHKLYDAIFLTRLCAAFQQTEISTIELNTGRTALSLTFVSDVAFIDRILCAIFVNKNIKNIIWEFNDLWMTNIAWESNTNLPWTVYGLLKTKRSVEFITGTNTLAKVASKINTKNIQLPVKYKFHDVSKSLCKKIKITIKCGYYNRADKVFNDISTILNEVPALEELTIKTPISLTDVRYASVLTHFTEILNQNLNFRKLSLNKIHETCLWQTSIESLIKNSSANCIDITFIPNVIYADRNDKFEFEFKSLYLLFLKKLKNYHSIYKQLTAENNKYPQIIGELCFDFCYDMKFTLQIQTNCEIDKKMREGTFCKVIALDEVMKYQKIFTNLGVLDKEYDDFVTKKCDYSCWFYGHKVF